ADFGERGRGWLRRALRGAPGRGLLRDRRALAARGGGADQGARRARRSAGRSLLSFRRGPGACRLAAERQAHRHRDARSHPPDGLTPAPRWTRQVRGVRGQGPGRSARLVMGAARAAHPTPRLTKALLTATVVATIAGIAGFTQARQTSAIDPQLAAGYLWFYSALFLVRVAGQLVARTRRPEWLPPDSEGDLTPYRLLPPVHLGDLGLMGRLDPDIARRAGVSAGPAAHHRPAVLWVAVAYRAG